MKKLLLFLLLTGVLAAQNTTVIQFSGVPSGSCSFVLYGYNSVNGDLYRCKLGAWQLLGNAAGFLADPGANGIVVRTAPNTTTVYSTTGSGSVVALQTSPSFATSATVNGGTGTLLSLANGGNTMSFGGLGSGNADISVFEQTMRVFNSFGNGDLQLGAGNALLATIYHAGGFFYGASPSDPGANNITAAGKLTGATFGSASNCSSSASPAVCASAAAGSFVIAAGATSVVVNTSAVTANSQVMLQEDSSLGTKLSVTCNTQSLLVLGVPKVTARTGGTSFTAAIEVGPTNNPLCVSYVIQN